MRRFLVPALALLPLSACADGGATPTEAASAAAAPSAVAMDRGPLARAGTEGQFQLSDGPLDLLISGSLIGEDPAGMGIYMERPRGIGDLPMAVVFRQDGKNLWGTGMDANTNEPYPDYVSVFQSSVGDVFRFREGGSAVLGNGIGRPEAEHVLTIVDRNNTRIENVLNLARSPDGNSRRFLRAFDGSGVAFAVASDGSTGIGKDFSEDVELDVAGQARARAYLQLEEPDLATDVEEVLDVLDEVRQLVPLRYTPTVGDGRPRYGLLDTFVHDALFPETVYRDATDGTRSVDYAQVTTLLVAAVRELTQRVEALEGGGRVGALPNLCRTPERRRPPGERAGAAPALQGSLPDGR